MTEDELSELKRTMAAVGLPVIDFEKVVKLHDSSIGKMKECVTYGLGDPEGAHLEADGILLEVLRELGFKELCDAFDKVNKWYS